MKRCIILYSGGMGSFLTAYLVKQSKVYDEIILYFNDTKTEDADLYRFLEETKTWLDLPLIRDSDGRDIWEVFQDRRYVGNTRQDTCSDVLKRKRSHKFIKGLFRPYNTDIAIGIDWTEIHRYERYATNMKPFKVIAPLIDDSMDKQILEREVLKLSGIKRPKLYDLGFAHNNCGGFCVKAGLAQFKLLLEKLPEVYAYHEQKEQETYRMIGSVKPFLKKTINGKIHYIIMKQYREFLDSGKALDYEESIDYGACGCAL